MKIDNRRYAPVIGALVGCAVMFWAGFAFAGAEVLLEGGDWAIGEVAISSVTTSGTEGDTWTATGSSDGTEDIYIKVEGTNWSPGAASGTNQFILKHDASESWGNPITNSGNGIPLVEDLEVFGTQDFDLQFTAPTGGNEGVEQTLTVTLTVSGWEEVAWYDIYGPAGTGDVVEIGSMYVARNTNTDGTANNGMKTWSGTSSWAAGLDWLTKTDWRLPTKTELLSIYADRSSLGTYNVDADYWSSTAGTADPATHHWVVLFHTGVSREYINTGTRPLRAVRTVE